MVTNWCECYSVGMLKELATVSMHPKWRKVYVRDVRKPGSGDVGDEHNEMKGRGKIRKANKARAGY